MRRRAKWIVGAAAAAALAGGGGGIAIASTVGDDDDGSETPITGTELRRASEAALGFTGQGRVTGTEAGDEESAYEVEVTLDNGKQTDVQLDELFNVVGSETDSGEDDESAGENE